MEAAEAGVEVIVDRERVSKEGVADQLAEVGQGDILRKSMMSWTIGSSTEVEDLRVRA